MPVSFRQFTRTSNSSLFFLFLSSPHSSKFIMPTYFNCLQHGWIQILKKSFRVPMEILKSKIKTCSLLELLLVTALSFMYMYSPFHRPRRPLGRLEVQLYSILDLYIRSGERSASRPGSTLPPGKTWYQLYRRLGGPQGRSGRVRKISPNRDSKPGPSSPYAVAIITELPGFYYNYIIKT